MDKEALYWSNRENNSVLCLLCPADCLLQEGKTGICGCRTNRGGSLITMNYGEVVSVAVDPIEKKPLFHFYPGSSILSTGPNGCNLKCENCQNWTISQQQIQTQYVSPSELVSLALQHNTIGIAFTYTEPTIWFEYIMDVAPLVREVGLHSVLVTNGYINEAPLRELISVVDAMNIDLKSMSGDFYKKVCKGHIDPILRNIKLVVEAGVHVEITNLVIPTLNDSAESIGELVDFVASISPRIPLHLSAYHPDFKMEIPATSLDILSEAEKIARQKLQYVYIGNVSCSSGQHTFCHSCQAMLIDRNQYQVKIVGLQGSRCSGCDAEVGIIC